MWKREFLERNRGLQADTFSEAMKKAAETKAEKAPIKTPWDDQKPEQTVLDDRNSGR